MRTREKSYEDYGFTGKEEVTHLIHFCRNKDFKFRHELLICAEMSNRSIATDIFDTIINDVSYDDLSSIKCVPISKVDFYAYRRNTLGRMREWMTEMDIKY